jgi:hypothetical protein
MPPTRKQLNRILSECTEKITLNVRFDPERARKALLHYDTLVPILALDRKGSAAKKQLEYIARYGKPSGTKLTYSTDKEVSKGWGRFACKDGKSYVAMSRKLRHYLACNLYSDHDIVNCHPELAQQLFSTFQLDCPNLRDWNTNRDKYFKLMQDSSRIEISRDDCKGIGFCFLYGGEVPYHFNTMQLPFNIPGPVQDLYEVCMGASKEMAGLMQTVKAAYPLQWSHFTYDIKKDNEDWGKFSSFMQHIERHILLRMYRAALQAGYEVGDLAHDGLFLSENGLPAKDCEKYYEYCTKDIKEDTGFSLKITGKVVLDPNWFPETKETIEWEKLEKYVPNTPTLITERMKRKYFSGLNDESIKVLALKILAKYFIRIKDVWWSINIDSRLPGTCYTQNEIKTTFASTILDGYFLSDIIPMYNTMVFKDPNDILDGEYNAFGVLKYDRDAFSVPLRDEELDLIKPFTEHFCLYLCSGVSENITFVKNVLSAKFREPFKVTKCSGYCLYFAGQPGNGKTMPLTKLFVNAFGSEYTNLAASFDQITSSPYTDGLDNKFVIMFPDMPPSERSNVKAYNYIKPLHTDEYSTSRPMYEKSKQVPNTLFICGSGQHRDVFHIDGDDRRYFMVDTKAPVDPDPDYYGKLALTIDQHWRLILRWICLQEPKKLAIPNTALRQHAISSSLCPVGSFLNYKLSYGWDLEAWDGARRALHKEYREWCKEYRVRNLTESKFFNILKDTYQFSEKHIADGNYVRFYIAKENLERFQKLCCWDGHVEYVEDQGVKASASAPALASASKITVDITRKELEAECLI